jgi:hypothetical protein
MIRMVQSSGRIRKIFKRYLDKKAPTTKGRITLEIKNAVTFNIHLYEKQIEQRAKNKLLAFL